MATIFPREEKAEALFGEILKNPEACHRLMDTFNDSLDMADVLDAPEISAQQFTTALFNAYANKDLSAFLMAICQHSMFDLLRNAALIPFKFNADGEPNPVILTDDAGVRCRQPHGGKDDRQNVAQDGENQGCGSIFRGFGCEKRAFPMGQPFASIQPGLYAGLQRLERSFRQQLFPVSRQGRGQRDENADREDRIWRQTMKYAGRPFGMWVLFAGSFQKQLTAAPTRGTVFCI